MVVLDVLKVRFEALPPFVRGMLVEFERENCKNLSQERDFGNGGIL